MWIYFVLRSSWFAPIQHRRPQKYFRRKQGVLYPDNLFWRDVSPAKCLWWCFLGWMLQTLQQCMQKFSGSHKAIQNSSALWLCFYKIIIFFFPPLKSSLRCLSMKTNESSHWTYIRACTWVTSVSDWVLYRLALKFCMSLVHSDSASSSGCSGLCSCLLWDNVCGNLYFGLLISVAADAYLFDSRKLIKGPALPSCSVFQCSVFPQLWGISLPLSSPQAGKDGGFLLCFLIPASREGFHTLATWKTLDLVHWAQDCTFPGDSHSGDHGLRTRPVSEQGSVSDWSHPELLHSQPWMLTTTSTFVVPEIFLGTSPGFF